MNQKIDLLAEFQSHLRLIKSSSTIYGALENLAILYERIKSEEPTKEIIVNLQNKLQQEQTKITTTRKKYFEWCCEKLFELKTILQKQPHIEKSKSFCDEIDQIVKFNFHYDQEGLYKTLQKLISNIVKTILKYDQKSYLPLSKWVKIHCIPYDKYEMIEVIFPSPDHRKPYFIDYLETPDKWEEKLDSCSLSIIFLIKILTICKPSEGIKYLFKGLKKDSNETFQEMENNKIIVRIGLFLMSFNNNDHSNHPYNIAQITALSEKLLNILQKEIDSNLYSLKKDKQNKKHWKAKQNTEDINALIPYAKKMWIKTIKKPKLPMKIGYKNLSSKLDSELPYTLSLHVDRDKRVPRIENALKLTDPRIYENGKYKGLKPHWENFNWLKS